jgi:diacylglycerol kinase family enzyme
MRYAIVANPASGGVAPRRKRDLLKEPAEILAAKIHGLDARTTEEFGECILEAARQCDVLVGAGGDGTLSMIVNAVDRTVTPVGFLPLGTGNAMRHALDLRGNLASMARQIRDGRIRHLDLVECGGRAAFSTSVGIEAAALRMRKNHPRLEGCGFCPYLAAALIAYARNYRRASGTLEVDGSEHRLKPLLTLLVVKHPFYGFRMNVVPQAKLDDGRLHVLAVTEGFWRSIFWSVASLFAPNRTGLYLAGKDVKAVFDRPLGLQTDGEVLWEARSFRFQVLERAVMVKA